MKNLNNILPYILLCLILWLIFKPESKPVFNVPKIKEIETRIHDTTIYINTIKERLKTIDLSDLNNKVDSLLELRKKTPDTITIIRIQDTIIKVQSKQIDTLEFINVSKDSIINVQDNVILSKDTIIDLQKHKVKRKNKQLLKVTLVAIVTSFIAIIK